LYAEEREGGVLLKTMAKTPVKKNDHLTGQDGYLSAYIKKDSYEH
jgi:hypothetical protein